MTDEKNNPPLQSNLSPFPGLSQLRQQAEQKARSMPLPDLDAMSHEEIRHMMYEMQVKQIEADLLVEQWHRQREERDDQAELFRIVTENMLDMVALTDMEGNFTFAGKSHEVLGYEPGFLIGKNVMDFVHPEDLPRILEAFDESVASGQFRKVEYRYRCEDGSYLWFETVGNFITDEKGTPQKIIFTSRDITERKQVEDALQESEARFRLLYEKAPLGYQSLDEKGHFIQVNQAWLDTLGYVREEVIGKSFADFLHPDWRDHFKENFPRFKAIGEILGVEFEMVKKNGAFILVFFNGKISKDKNGNFQQTHCIFYDITERKQAEEAIENERAYLSSVIDNIEEAIVICDAEGRIARFNETARRLHGLPEQPIPPDQWAQHYDLYQEDGVTPLPTEEIPLFRALQGERVLNAEIVVAPKHSHPYFLVCNGQALTDETGKITGAVVAMHDITERKRMEEALRRERNFNQRYLDTTQTIMMALDTEGRITMINRSGRELFGYAEDEILGCNWFETFLPQPEGKDNVFPVFQRILSGDLSSAEYFENSVVCRDGTQRLIGWHNAFLEDDDGRVVGALTSGEDITERKQAEEALRKSEEKFRFLFEKAGEGILIARGETIEFANPALEDILEYPIDRITSESFVAFIHPDDSETIRDLHLRMMQGEFLEKRYDFRIVTSDGTVKWVSIHAQVIEWEGAPANLSFVIDITERKQAEQRLRESKEKYRMLVENLTEVIYTLDEKGRITYVSPTVELTGGYTPSELLGKQFVDFVHPDDRARRLKPLHKNLSGIYGASEYRFVTKGNQVVWVRTTARPLLKEGRVIGLQGVLVDITERKKAEQERDKLQAQLNQAQKMESVGRLAGGVAHDFNNKLTIINGYAEMAIDMMDPSDPLRESIQEIYKAGNQSAHIVRQLLTYARKQTISPVQLDLNDIVSSMLKMLQRLIGENIDVIWQPGKNLWPIKIDPAQVEQIMVNLATNARDAISDVGKLTIASKNTVIDEDYCETNPGAMPGRYVMLAVSDNGCGMEKHVMDQLFEPYFTTKEVGKGSGLGLPTIFGIIKQNKGFLNVYSEIGEGTTFRLYFPSCETEITSGHAPKEFKGDIFGGTETILVVEDEKGVLHMARRILERLGYTVQTAEKPYEALKFSEAYEGTIHLLLTDVVMPEMNGRDLSSQMTISRPELKTLYMSSYTTNEIAHTGVLDPDVLFIHKPLSLQELAAKVREAIEQG